MTLASALSRFDPSKTLSQIGATADRLLARAGRLRHILAVAPFWIVLAKPLLPAAIWPETLWRTAPLLLLTPSVLLAGALGGAAPGFAATAIGLAIGLYFHFAPVGRVMAEGGVGLWSQAIVFIAIGVGSASFGEVLRRSLIQNRKTLAELRGREARLQSVIDTAPDAVILIDADGAIQAFSKSAERLFGYQAGEVAGQNVSLLTPFPHRNNHDFYLRRYEETGERKIIGIGRVVVGERKDGSTFPIELAVGEIRLEGRRFYTGFIRDLSERQSTEARMQELQAELVHMSRLNAMGEMSSALAHEVNQPLSAISNYLTGVRRLLQSSGVLDSQDPLMTKVRDALDRASDQALRAGEIIRRLRDFVRRGETDQRPESLAKIIEEASALALVGAKEFNVRVTFRLDPSVDRILADRVQVQQVLLNLIRNALEAMRDQPRRELRIESRACDDDLVEVSVSDTGPGLSPELEAELFKPFFTTKSTGMGVGLSICRTIIDAHGGEISAKSLTEGGARFQFTLRLAPAGTLEAERA